MQSMLRSNYVPIKVRQRWIFPVVLLTLCPLALSSDLQRQDQLVWDFGEFVQEFSAKNWPKLVRFVGPETKIGLGGEMGFEGLMQIFGEDDYCHDAMLQALKMGCRKAGVAEDMRCVSPPQLGPDVVYLGARASFRYNVENGLWMAETLICGGD